MTRQPRGQVRGIRDARPHRDPAGRPPAHDLAAEELVVSALLVEADAIGRVMDLVSPDEFWTAPLRAVARAAFALAESGSTVGIAEVKNWLIEHDGLAAVGGAAELARLADEVPSEDRLERAAKRIRAKARVRAMAEAAAHILADAYDRIDDVNEFMQRAEAAVSLVARSSGSSEVTRLRDALGEVFSDIQARAERGDTSKISTGFQSLDQRLGGFFGGEMTVLAGRPGMGKTGVAMEMALRIAGTRTHDDTPNSVLVFSQEMQRPQLVTRMICTQARVNVAAFRSEAMLPDDWTRLTEAARWMADRELMIDDRVALSPLDIRGKTRRVQADEARAKRRLGLVIVDYLQLCSARSMMSDRENRQEEVALIARELKRLSKELNIPVLALAQLNRAVDTAKDKRPTLSSLRESGAIEQDADCIIFVHREEYYLRERTPPDQKGVAELIVQKGRMGGEGTTLLRYRGDCGLFTEEG